MITRETFYRSEQWARLRRQLMMERVNEHGELICADCGKPILRPYDCIAHHIRELTDENVNDFSVSLNPENIALIHFRCHNERHKRFGGFEQRVFLVYGPPCAGKTTWVHSVATADDLILDIDAIWEAVSSCDKYHKPKRLKANVFGIRDAIIDQIRTRTGMWVNAYIIGGYPLKTERDRLRGLLRAEPIFIQATREECLTRCVVDSWREYIDEWFDSFVE